MIVRSFTYYVYISYSLPNVCGLWIWSFQVILLGQDGLSRAWVGLQKLQKTMTAPLGILSIYRDVCKNCLAQHNSMGDKRSFPNFTRQYFYDLSWEQWIQLACILPLFYLWTFHSLRLITVKRCSGLFNVSSFYVSRNERLNMFQVCLVYLILCQWLDCRSLVQGTNVHYRWFGFSVTKLWGWIMQTCELYNLNLSCWKSFRFRLAKAGCFSVSAAYIRSRWPQ